MCGIGGAFGVPGVAIERITEAMRHRGPDDAGIFADGIVALGMRRLAVIDTSGAGHQPMANDDESVWIVYNGETYNFLEERKRLEAAGVRFRSNADTEVALRLYEERGDEFVSRMRGMFALAIYDRRRGPGRERLLLARDPLGVKPLLYAETAGGIVFASEMKGLLASGVVQPRIDPEGLRLLLTFGAIPQPTTVIEGVKMLPAGHRLVVEAGRRQLEPYWSLQTDRVAGLRGASYAEQVERVRHEVGESLRLQLVSDVPLGAFLSGGVDSSVLVALMTRHAAGRVRTFSIGFGEEGAGIDESGAAERTAAALGTEHRKVQVSAVDVRGHIEHFARSLDQPSMDGLNGYFVSRAAREGVTVAVSGTGGDELFGGYPWFATMASRAAAEPGPMTSLLASVARGGAFDRLAAGRHAGRVDRLRASAGFLPGYARLHGAFGAPGAARVLAGGLRDCAAAGREPARDIAHQDELAHASPVARVGALCLRGYTQNQLLRDIDAVSMAHSLEVRVPFLDHKLVDMSLSLPDAAKLAAGEGAGDPVTATYRASGSKRVLVDAFRDLLPADIDLQPKRGFSMPYVDWLNGSLADVAQDVLSDESVRRRGLFDPAEVARVRERFARGAAPWTHPWTLMITELWCREVLDGAGRR